eukprot:s399_g44.t1
MKKPINIPFYRFKIPSKSTEISGPAGVWSDWSREGSAKSSLRHRGRATVVLRTRSGGAAVTAASSSSNDRGRASHQWPRASHIALSEDGLIHTPRLPLKLGRK